MRGQNRGRIWLGLKRDEEGNFAWSSGLPVTYENWKDGEPDDNKSKNCVEMMGAGDGGWRTKNCETDFIGWFFCSTH